MIWTPNGFCRIYHFTLVFNYSQSFTFIISEASENGRTFRTICQNNKNKKNMPRSHNLSSQQLSGHKWNANEEPFLLSLSPTLSLFMKKKNPFEAVMLLPQSITHYTFMTRFSFISMIFEFALKKNGNFIVERVKFK